MKENIAVKVENVKKSFRLPTESTNSLRTTLVNYFRGIKGYREQEVLKDISFEVEKGDFFGIVGRNGSGKSTLLKIISEIYVPEKGSVEINGRLVSFIELGVGFNPELTGIENVYLNGALLGFSTQEIDEMYDDIVDFAELHDFMNQKLKNYSSGMQVRLAFSVAIQAKSEILVLDEILAVGDEAFQRKCNDYFLQAKKEGKTIILVTHDMSSVRKYCNKAVLIRGGKIVIEGSPEDVASQYTLDNYESVDKQETKKVEKEDTDGEKHRCPLGLCELVPDIKIVAVSKQNLKSGEDFSCIIEYEVTKPLPVVMGLSLVSDDIPGSIIDSGGRDEKGQFIIRSTEKGHYSFKWTLPTDTLNKGNFKVVVTLFNLKDGKAENIAYTDAERSLRFFVASANKTNPLLQEKGNWSSLN